MIQRWFARQGVWKDKLGFFYWVGCVFWVMTSVAQSNPGGDANIGFVARPDWMGDPYLMTNPPNSALSAFRVSLVMNPTRMNDPAYQAKVTALAASAVPVSEPEVRGPSLVERLKAAFVRATAVPAGKPPVDPAPAADPSWSLRLERWGLLGWVAGLLAWRLWRFFFVTRTDDDFAGRLATMAKAHRWVFPVYLLLLVAVVAAELFQWSNVFFSLSLLLLAAALRRYYCEGDFVNHPWAQKVHLAMNLGLIWLGWNLEHDHYLSDFATWDRGAVYGWLALALAAQIFSRFYNSELARHRGELYAFLLGIFVLGLAGAGGGHYLWNRGLLPVNRWLAVGVGALVAALPAVLLFVRWLRRVAAQEVGGYVYDLLFSEGLFAEKSRPAKHLPEMMLLQHWRSLGETEKAWQTAEQNLVPESRALPIWLFAMETAVLYRRQPSDALRILRQLVKCEEFSTDQRNVAAGQVQGWMAAAGYAFNAAQFQVEAPPRQPATVTDRVEQKCRDGRFREAAFMLEEILQDDPLNEAAFVQLVRIYCQDLKNRPQAERLIAGGRDTFSPKLLDYLAQSLDEWLRLPVRSQVKRQRFPGWFRRAEPEDPESRKLKITAPPITQSPVAKAKAKGGDAMDSYLDRVRQVQSMPDTTGVFDPVQKLLLERRLGTAVELIKQKAEAAPQDFNLWLRYAEAHGDHCGDITAAERVIRQMERSGHFKKAQMKKVNTQLKKWRKKHAAHHNW